MSTVSLLTVRNLTTGGTIILTGSCGDIANTLEALGAFYTTNDFSLTLAREDGTIRVEDCKADSNRLLCLCTMIADQTA